MECIPLSFVVRIAQWAKYYFVQVIKTVRNIHTHKTEAHRSLMKAAFT